MSERAGQFTLRRLFSVVTIACILLALFGPRAFSSEARPFWETVGAMIVNPTLWLFRCELIELGSPREPGVAFGGGIGLTLSVIAHAVLVVILFGVLRLIWRKGN